MRLFYTARAFQMGNVIGGVGIGSGATLDLLVDDFVTGATFFDVPEDHVLALTSFSNGALTTAFVLEVTTTRGGVSIVTQHAVPMGQLLIVPVLVAAGPCRVSALIRNRSTAVSGTNIVHSLNGIVASVDDFARVMEKASPLFAATVY